MIEFANILDVIMPFGEKVFYFLQVVIFFGILIAVHEFGHFIAGKLTGMKVEEFAVGFGKRLIGFRKGETEYSLRIVPLGGYCKIFGMEDESETEATSESDAEKVEIPQEDLDRAFVNKPIWARFVVIIAGSLMNIVLAIVLIAIIGSSIGFNYSRVESVQEDSPAERAGIQPGDKLRLYGYNSRAGNIVQAVQDADPAKGVMFRVERDGESHKIRVKPEMVTEDNVTVPRIGISFDIQDNTSLVVARVLRDSPYSRAGIQEGDEFIAINGEPVESGYEFVSRLHESEDNKAQVKIRRDDKEFTFLMEDFLIYRTGLIAETVQKGDEYELTVQDIIIETPAHYAGLRPGMRISKIDDKPITEDFNWSAFENQYDENVFMIEVYDPRTDSEPVTIPLSRVMNHPGLMLQINYVKVPFGQAIYEASLQAKTFGLLIFDVLGQLFTKRAQVRELSGPVGIFMMGYTAASYGIVEFIILFALISVNLGIINMLPLPALDGGRAVFLIVEMVLRRPVMKSNIENIIHNVGFILLIALFLYVTFIDFGRIINMFS